MKHRGLEIYTYQVPINNVFKNLMFTLASCVCPYKLLKSLISFWFLYISAQFYSQVCETLVKSYHITDCYIAGLDTETSSNFSQNLKSKI